MGWNPLATSRVVADGTQINLVSRPAVSIPSIRMGRSSATRHAPGFRIFRPGRPTAKPFALAWTSARCTQASGEMAADGSGCIRFSPARKAAASQSAGSGAATARYFLFLRLCENYDCNLLGTPAKPGIGSPSHLGPVQIDAWPDSLHVAIPSETGSRRICFQFPLESRTQKIEPQSHHAESLILNANAEIASVSPEAILLCTRSSGRFAVAEQRRWLSAPAPNQTSLVASAPHGRGRKADSFTGARPGYVRKSISSPRMAAACRPVLPEGREAPTPIGRPTQRKSSVSMPKKKTQPKFGNLLVQIKH